MVWHLLQAKPVESIVATFPSLREAEVHAALAFYYDNREMVDQLIVDEDQAEERFRREHRERVIDLRGG